MNRVIFPLKLGSKGPDVANLFEAIKFLVKIKILQVDGELDAEIEGNRYGDVTAQLVYLFREQNSLLRGDRRTDPIDFKNNYEVDQSVADKINAFLKEQGAFRRIDPEAPHFERDKATLKPGMKTDAVSLLQKQLRQLGYDFIDVEGYFGRSTRSTVEEFQKKHHLDVTGIVNEETTNTINSELERQVEEPKPARRLVLNKKELLKLEKKSDVSPLDLKISDPEAFSQLQALAVTELEEFITEYFINSPDSIKERIGLINIPVLVEEQKNVKAELLKWVEELLESGISKEEAEDAKVRIEGLEHTSIPKNPLDIDEPLENHPLVHQQIQQARFYRLSDVVKVTDQAVETVLEVSPNLYTLDDELLASLVRDKNKKINEDEAKKLGLAVNLYQLFDQDMEFAEYFIANKVTMGRNPVKKIKDLIGIERAEWEDVITQSSINLPKESDIKQRAYQLVKRVERLYPSESLQRKFSPPEHRDLVARLEKLQPLFKQSKSVFGGSGLQAIDMTGVSADETRSIQEQYRKAEQMINTYAGLKLEEILNKPNLTSVDKAELIQQRVGLLDRFREQNSNIELLALDYMPDSKDLTVLDVNDFRPAEKKMIFSHMKVRQRLFDVTGDVSDTRLLLEKGFDSAVSITQRGFRYFKAKTELDDKKSEKYFESAENTMTRVNAGMGSIFDVVGGGFKNLNVSNIGPDISEYLKQLDGYEDLFGNQTYCNCQHCRSMLSPSAYFVDLMRVVEDRVLVPTFSGNPGHAINLKVRRPDLWTLDLNCKNTDTLIPTLDLANEILENYIYTSGEVKEREKIEDKDRRKIEKGVYKKLYELQKPYKSPKSFTQPFCLPLEKLRIYLKHFELTRSDVAHLLEADNSIQIQAALEISQEEYNLIISEKNNTKVFLDDLFGIKFDFEDCNAQKLLRPMGLSRKELGQLVTSRFVTADSRSIISISAEKNDREISIQNDIERIRGLSYERLDRMHRFTRLWKKLDWSIEELDLVLSRLEHKNLSNLSDITALLDIQKRLDLTVEQTCGLWGSIPNEPTKEGKKSHLDRLFNMSPFGIPLDRFPAPEKLFLHPFFSKESEVEKETNNSLQRMLAGLKISDDELVQLIQILIELQALKPKQKDSSFLLNLSNLSLLYRHTLLARQLKLTISELFTLIKHADVESAYIKDLDEVTALLTIYDFYVSWKEKGYSLDDIDYIQGNAPEKPEDYIDGNDIAQKMVDRIQNNKSLEFADTIFTLIPGVTEDDSREIIAINLPKIDNKGKLIQPDKSVIESTDSVKNTYKISANMISVTSLILPKEIIESVAKINEITAKKAKHCLQNTIINYHASKLISIELAATLNFSVDKTESLISLTETDLFNKSFREAMHGRNSKGAVKLLAKLIDKVLPLSVLFKKSFYDQDALDFIGKSGGIFSVDDFNFITVESIKQLALYENFADISDEIGFSEEEPESCSEHSHLSLKALKKNVIDDGSISSIAKVLNARPVLVTSIVNTLKTGKLLSGSPLDALKKIAECTKIAQHLGVGGDTLRLIVSKEYDDLYLASDALLGAFRAKYSDDKEWKEKSDPYEDLIRSRKRDGLTDYLMHVTPSEVFSSDKELYQYFLIDVELTGCARTSRLVAAMSSLQLYVHRVLMNLEKTDSPSPRYNKKKNKKLKKNYIHARPDNSEHFKQEWKWRKNYRVWEANRKVFLFPETYIEPELRDNKTPLFEELESTLLQQEVNEQNVLDAYAAYMAGFEEVAKLKIAGSYHDKGANAEIGDNLHLFGVTPSDPPTYYYRVVENTHYGEVDPNKGIIWNPWKKIEVQIPVRKVSPIVFQGRLYVFWVEIRTTPKNKVVNGSSRFIGYQHKMLIKYTMLRLDDTWTVPQKLSLPESMEIVDDLLEEINELNILKGSLLHTNILSKKQIKTLERRVKDESPSDPNEYNKIISDLNNNHIESSKWVENWSKIEALFTPEHDDKIHKEPKESYTLSGVFWEQLDTHIDLKGKLIISIPSIKKSGQFDLYSKSILPISIDTKGALRYENFLYFSYSDKLQYYRTFLDLSNWAVQYPFSGGEYTKELSLLANTDVNHNHYTLFKRNLNEFLIQLPHTDIMQLKNTDEISVINGSFENYIIDVLGDIFLLQESVLSERPGYYFSTHLLKRIGTTCSEDISRLLSSEGVDKVLDINTQDKSLGEKSLPFKIMERYHCELVKFDKSTVGKLNFTGSYGTYYREIFFHIPFLIANHLNSQQKFEAAHKWYRSIFDPTASEKTDPARDSNWRYLEFRDLDLPNLRKMLQDKEAQATYEKDPFNPHAIARQRLTAYQKSIVMKYIDNLLDWGDKLFSRFTMESVNEATNLYIMASDILGERPVELGECGEGGLKRRNYQNIKPLMKKGSSFLIEVESLKNKKELYSDGEGSYSTVLPKYEFMMRNTVFATARDMALHDKPLMRTDWNKTSSGLRYNSLNTESKINYDHLVRDHSSEASGNTEAAYFDNTSFEHDAHHESLSMKLPIEIFRQTSPIFCYPVNKELMSYWDRVDDRLYKIRHCMDITGVRRQLELLAPEIDPRLLVRAKTAGLSIEDVLNATSGDLPPYRFEYLIQKAQSYAGTVQSFGSSLLSALEKKDAEELSRLRLVHEQNIQKLTTKIKEWEIKVESESIQALERQQEAALYNESYFEELVDEGLTNWEKLQAIAQHSEVSLQKLASIFSTTAATLYITPQVGSPFAMKFGGKEIGDSNGAWSKVFNALSFVGEAVSRSAGIESNFQRREQGWKHQLKLAKHELNQIEKKLLGAEIRMNIAQKSLDIHNKSIEQTEEMFELYGSKFSNFGLYTWLSKTLHGLYRDAYNSAYSMARLAEQAYQFERSYDASVSLGESAWDASKAGLLSGEKLLLSLQQMEQRFIETNYRNLEIDQSFSVKQLDPLALYQLREQGECEFFINELFYDMFYPGHYKRKIKAVRISIPCVTGPYTNIGATLSLTKSEIRLEPKAETELVNVPLQRSVTIATSKAQNDSGVFEFNFHDQRYMPFEGAGAISDWKLKLPKNFRQFDYQTISDVILHISYTAESDENLRIEVEGKQEKARAILNNG